METERHGPVGAGAHTDNSDESHVTYLPLVDHECKLLPVHFLNGTEVSQELSCNSSAKGWCTYYKANP